MSQPRVTAEDSASTPGPPVPSTAGDVGAREHDSGGESTGTVVVAGVANLGIAIAKFVGGLISHSSAMMSEAAHSVADTITEVLLFVALKRGNRPPDERHLFGYGRETYFWAFLAHLTGDPVWDGVSAILIGVLLLLVAGALSRANASLLIGQSAAPRIER